MPAAPDPPPAPRAHSAASMELGESIRKTAVRETQEETGTDIEIVGIVGIYYGLSPPDRVRRRRGPAAIQHLLPRALVGGAVRLSDESTDIRWVRLASSTTSRFTTPRGCPLITS